MEIGLCRSGLSLAFGGAPPGSLVLACQPDDIAGLTVEGAANSFEGVEVDAERLALLQAPEGGVTDARLFGQPVERAFVVFQ